jgi:hypothetical protein
MMDLAEKRAIFIAKRDVVFLNPTLEGAKKLLEEQGLSDFVRDDVPLATCHKARLQWLDATDEMLTESIAWLKAHGYDATTENAPPLTPESRDKQRTAMGKEPLNKRSAP